VNAAVALLGAEHRLVGHATARYHAVHRPARLAPVAAEAPRAPTLLHGEEPPVAEQLPQAEEASTPASQVAESLLPTERAPPQAPPRPKGTQGVQPRSWLRLQRRLRGNGHLQGCRAEHPGE